ncbi:unnamed protein product [Gongylonema pulchrum]|uniref:Uncharacterized protein n=1 Tax=Gongylonema pulchrum TaxID=637853 RepID=A0A183ETL5_9BILA|nr:unnamed protein product [Gongylonema pulchrum]
MDLREAVERLRRIAARSMDDDRLQIVEIADDEDSREAFARPPESDENEEQDDMLAAVLNELVDRTCESHTTSRELITEPLRRPVSVLAEPRRVPPLRLRLPRSREQRKRCSGRRHAYSPPLPGVRSLQVEQKKKRAAELSVSSSRDSGRLFKRYCVLKCFPSHINVCWYELFATGNSIVARISVKLCGLRHP